MWYGFKPTCNLCKSTNCELNINIMREQINQNLEEQHQRLIEQVDEEPPKKSKKI